MSLSLITAAMLIALLGAGHCASMCGPTTIAIVLKQERPSFAVWAHAGRITTYAGMGALIAWFSTTTTQILRNEVLQTAWFLLPNAFILWTALYLLGVRGAYAPVERGGRTLFAHAERWRLRLPMQEGALAEYSKGLAWGFLPCGLVYSALSIAVLSSSPWGGALVMAAFGSATLPVLMGIGLLSRRGVSVLQKPTIRKGLGLLLVLIVVWNLYLLPDRLAGVKFSFLC